MNQNKVGVPHVVILNMVEDGMTKRLKIISFIWNYLL